MPQGGKFGEEGEESSIVLQEGMANGTEGSSSLKEQTSSAVTATANIDSTRDTVEDTDNEISFGITPVRTSFHSPTPPRSRKKSPGRPKKSKPRSSTPITNCIIEDVNCPICKCDVTDDVKGLMCDVCQVWFHCSCLLVSDQEYESLSESAEAWCCVGCKTGDVNQLRWGGLRGENVIQQVIKATHSEITKWRKNLFLLPRGKAGVHFINEMTRLIYLFTDQTAWKELSLSMLHVFIPLMLQKPSPNSKAKNNAKFLADRLAKWSEGDLQSLIDEGREIQVRLVQSVKSKEVSCHVAFTRLMMLGQVGKAIKLINNNDDVKGVHKLSRHVKTVLACKHPDGKQAPPQLKMEITSPEPQPVIFEHIDSQMVHRVAKTMHGSGGPTLIDADAWKHILCCKSYGKASEKLCESIAELAKCISTKHISPAALDEFLACRLIPLDKGNDKQGRIGVRPVGVGEVLRRIVGKLVIGVLKSDIQNAAGPLQTCAGLKGGIEASIHATREQWELPDTQGVLLVDADNAFNTINRKLAVHNIRQLCPPFHRFIMNTYQKPSTLVVSDGYKTEYMGSYEGCTQGDVAAMAFYALGVRPLISELSSAVDSSACKQIWYADDSTATGQLAEIKKWWDFLCQRGPAYGYNPKPSKTVLIVKEDCVQTAKKMFEGCGITITSEGERHLGAVVGTEAFKKSYVTDKVAKWVKDVEELSEIGKDDPQAAYCAFTKALSHRWTFVQRTIPSISELFDPLEDAIKNKFLPAIIGRHISDEERKLFSLPVRLGGLGVSNPVEGAEFEFQASEKITENLKKLITDQQQGLDGYLQEQAAERTRECMKDKEVKLLRKVTDVKSGSSEELKRSITLAQEKGAGAWLTVLPIGSLGWVLNKEEFRDALRLRYGWQIPNIPAFCVCGKRNSVDHTLVCKHGGYLIFRHNKVRDTNAAFLREVCHDVKTEPELIPIDSSQQLPGNTEERARLDISARGLWGPFQKTMFDVRIFHPNADSYRNRDIKSVYTQHENIKRKNYEQRVIQVEKCSFTPLVYSTSGGMAPQAMVFHKKLAELIAEKTNEEYRDVISTMRTKLSFALLRSVLVSVRGYRGKPSRVSELPVSAISFNLIPDGLSGDSVRLKF